MNTTQTNGNWTKIGSEWGVRYFSGKSGETITVEKKDGTTSQIELGAEVETGSYRIIQQAKKSSYVKYARRTRDEWRELIDQQDCDCEHYHTARRPCDGWA